MLFSKYTGNWTFDDTQSSCTVTSYKFNRHGQIELEITEERKSEQISNVFFKGIASKSGQVYKTPFVKLCNSAGEVIEGCDVRISFTVINTDSERITVKGTWDEKDVDLYPFTGYLDLVSSTTAG